jgi:hypothetical protein
VPVLGIQNFDRMMRRVELMEKACREETREEAMAAAGDVLADALVGATPVGKRAHKTYKRTGEYRPAGTARSSVINVPARSKKYGVSRRLIGYSKSAYYMLWVIKGHKMVTGGERGKPGSGRLKRRASAKTNTHSQGGKGKVVGHVQGRDFMSRIFKANIGRAMDVAKEVIRRAARGETTSKRGAA